MPNRILSIYTFFNQINSKLNNYLLNKLFCQFSTIMRVGLLIWGGCREGEQGNYNK